MGMLGIGLSSAGVLLAMTGLHEGQARRRYQTGFAFMVLGSALQIVAQAY